MHDVKSITLYYICEWFVRKKKEVTAPPPALQRYPMKTIRGIFTSFYKFDFEYFNIGPYYTRSSWNDAAEYATEEQSAF